MSILFNDSMNIQHVSLTFKLSFKGILMVNFISMKDQELLHAPDWWIWNLMLWIFNIKQLNLSVKILLEHCKDERVYINLGQMVVWQLGIGIIFKTEAFCLSLSQSPVMNSSCDFCLFSLVLQLWSILKSPQWNLKRTPKIWLWESLNQINAFLSFNYGLIKRLKVLH
jgi:hypothetical protein